MLQLFIAAAFVVTLITALFIFRQVIGIFKLVGQRLEGYTNSNKDSAMDAARKAFIINKLRAEHKISDEEAMMFQHMQWQQLLMHLEQQRLFTEQMQRDMRMFNEQMMRDMEEMNLHSQQFQEQVQRDIEEMNRQQEQMNQQMFHNNMFHNF